MQAPPREQAYTFYRHILANDLCHFVALINEEVVGWCDILPSIGEARNHIGILGIGLCAKTRHQAECILY